jgi:hypothetical protein
MNAIEALITAILIFWILGLSFSFLLHNPNGYMRWTRESLRYIWRNAWQFIVGIALGYILSGNPIFQF